MSGKLPIDRVREATDAPRIYELEKQRFAEHEAELHHEGAPGPAPAGPSPDQADGHEHDQDDPEQPGPPEGGDRA